MTPTAGQLILLVNRIREFLRRRFRNEIPWPHPLVLTGMFVCVFSHDVGMPGWMWGPSRWLCLGLATRCHIS